MLVSLARRAAAGPVARPHARRGRVAAARSAVALIPYTVRFGSVNGQVFMATDTAARRIATPHSGLRYRRWRFHRPLPLPLDTNSHPTRDLQQKAAERDDPFAETRGD